ncbi:MAG: hypothetical protein GTO74_02965 [Hydrogenophaga sp.]|uniref:fatty acid desaturase n=1 Tax=Hydrogenophaga sp. TaxID=1904254 RepID=UPI0016B9E523|nr:fatty acid desaturase [Hydrogenophaga sp.]NIM40168.1 hypothetical protein [Hydrogenophaga sp.]NIO52817.1 hypothetical protein [Hydrogenophaga sp.]NIO88797.1 hypothetical protein [Hydrogenophaga sp.]NIT49388.1 hypothetical protein [Hydrogenophaga sp.]
MGARVVYSAYGPRFNVRQDYDRLLGQRFWTWLTGKGRVLNASERAHAMRPLSNARTLAHLFGSWVAIGLALWIGDRAASSTSAMLAVLGVAACWLVVVNRGRSLQACFHYMTHGAAMPHRGLAQLVATVLFTAPFLYQSWRAYNASHVKTHHHLRVLCSDDDPDQCFIAANGLRPGMPEWAFWLRVWLRPFAPSFIRGQLREGFLHTLIEPDWPERLWRLLVLAVPLGLALAHGWLDRFLLLFWLPVLLLLPHSLWLQLITEHLWFAPRDAQTGTASGYGRLTWGRFQGRPLPRGGLLAWARWWGAALAFDVPVRLYVYPQDLPNHDFHHRFPLAPYHAIADLRRTCEREASRFGPVREVWGFLAGLRMLRDHLCHADAAPFRFSAVTPPLLRRTHHERRHPYRPTRSRDQGLRPTGWQDTVLGAGHRLPAPSLRSRPQRADTGGRRR